MYSALWRLLPGPKYVKALELSLLFALIVLLLFQWVYPWANEYLHLTGNTVGQ